MPNYRGRIESLVEGVLTGFIVDQDAPDRPVPLLVTVNGGPALPAVADIPRSATQAGASVGGGNRSGFRVDLAQSLARCRSDIEIRITTADGLFELPGSPVSVGVAADAYVDPTRGGVVVGWAHGAWFERCNVELWSGRTFLLGWPADQLRDDLVHAGVGNGQCAFHIPIRLIFGDSPPKDLRIRIAGEPIDLAVPADVTTHDPPGREIAAARANAFGSLEELYRELERETAAHAERTVAGPGDIEVSFEALQSLLDQIEHLANERAALLQRQAMAEDARPDDASAPQAHGAASRQTDLASLVATRAAETGETASEIITKELVETYARDPTFRQPLLTVLAQQTDRALLSEVTSAFLAADFMQVAHRAAEVRAALDGAPTRAAMRQLRRLSAWVRIIERPRITWPEPLDLPINRATGRTLYCTWRGLPYETAGYDTRSHYLLRGLINAGGDVIACTRPGFPWDARRSTPLQSFEQLDGVQYVRLGSPGMSNQSLPLDAYIDAHANRICHLALACGADMIHSATNWLVGLPALTAAKRLGLPFVYEMRGLMEVTRASTTPLYAASDHFELFRRMESEIASAADLVFAITSGVRDEMARRGCDTSRFRLAPNGVDVERFQPLERNNKLAVKYGIGSEMVFGFVGSFVHYEGLLDLCAAAAALKARGRHFKLLLVGDGAQSADVRKAVDSLGIADVTILTGHVSFELVPDLYSLVDVAVYPRRGIEVTEIVSPLKPFEAMAMGKAVIGSNVAAIADIVRHGQTGWLFEKNDTDALIAAMELALADPQATEAMGAAARDFVVAEHDWTDIARRVISGWDDMRKGRAAAG